MGGLGCCLNSGWAFKKSTNTRTGQFVKNKPEDTDYVLWRQFWFGTKISNARAGLLKIFAGGAWNPVWQGSLKKWTGSIWQAIGINKFMVFKNDEYQYIELSGFTAGTHLTNGQVITATGNYIIPPGITSIKVECFGGGGGGNKPSSGIPSGGSGGGAYAVRNAIAVTPYQSYTFTVASQAPQQTNGYSSTFTGDDLTCTAAGGSKSSGRIGGAGGAIASSVGDIIYAGGAGGNGGTLVGHGGGGGGEGASASGTGNAGDSTSTNIGAQGGSGGPGGNGGKGGDYLSNGDPGIAYGGGGGGAGGNSIYDGTTGAQGKIIVTFN